MTSSMNGFAATAFAVVAGLGGCVETEAVASLAVCFADTDCKHGRSCIDGECVGPFERDGGDAVRPNDDRAEPRDASSEEVSDGGSAGPDDGGSNGAPPDGGDSDGSGSDGGDSDGSGSNGSGSNGSGSSICGDGIVQFDAGEECDLGAELNDGSYDGCAPTCVLGPRCGDGERQLDLESPEECDDGNRRNGDGCSFDCRSERLPE